ncbi:MAG: AmmeMemoRadiSam system protein A [Dehalococcoidia bacterium]|nr:MAG: AmmeMemoRadiSam system protein A [Dehalococcoidia bacterium]
MSGIVFGCIVPHPPLLVPEVGGGRESEISSTIRAMEELTRQLAGRRPETVLVISPHGTMLYDSMGIATASRLRGTMRNWGARSADHDFNNDPDMVAALQAEASTAGIPLDSIGDREYTLDHGVMVPIYFLVDGMKGVPLVPLTFSLMPLSTHFNFGQAIRKAAERAGKRVVIVASGDLSHRLIPSAPAGYDPMGEVFDRQLVDAIRSYDVPAVMGFDEALIDRAGECGLRSFVILLGALDGLNVKPDVLSYEGPFGVGYLVAAFDIEETEAEGREMHPLTRLARDTVEGFIREGKLPQPRDLTPEMQEKAGVFVSIKMHGQLRGCIGTFEPKHPNVAEEIIDNAVNSAVRDPRFLPVTAEELPDLTYNVDVLTRPEPVEGEEGLDPRRYGVIVESGNRRGLLLPDLEGVDTLKQQIDICRQKAGILPDEPVKLYRFEVKRYK